VYSLGLGIPFLLSGMLFTKALGVVRSLRRHFRAVSAVAGGMMIAFGILLATGALVRLIAHLSGLTGWQI
jgi:cytochrome c-type biogenesis protein